MRVFVEADFFFPNGNDGLEDNFKKMLKTMLNGM
jgi:hypothetical protein